jgi:predicted nucleotidyltransferase
LADLSANGVDFILVGGLAVALVGYVRATEDVDILVEARSSNIRRLLDTLEGFGEGAARELEVRDFTLEEGAIRIVEDFPLDIFTQMSGYTYADLLRLAEEHELGDATIRYLNAEGLILLKAESLRPKDQLDVQALRRIASDAEDRT